MKKKKEKKKNRKKKQKVLKDIKKNLTVNYNIFNTKNIIEQIGIMYENYENRVKDFITEVK